MYCIQLYCIIVLPILLFCKNCNKIHWNKIIFIMMWSTCFDQPWSWPFPGEFYSLPTRPIVCSAKSSTVNFLCALLIRVFTLVWGAEAGMKYLNLNSLKWTLCSFGINFSHRDFSSPGMIVIMFFFSFLKRTLQSLTQEDAIFGHCPLSQSPPSALSLALSIHPCVTLKHSQMDRETLYVLFLTCSHKTMYSEYSI